MSMLTTWLESLAYEIQINTQCLHTISPKSSCQNCSVACPQNAITITESKAAINEELCTKCGACIPVCPQSSIQGRSPERFTVKDILLVDEGHPPPGVEELLYFYKKGIRYLSGNEDAQISLDTTNRLLLEMGLEPIKKSVIPEALEAAPSYSRRGFFQKISFEGRRLAAESITPVAWQFNHEVFNMTSMFDKISLYETIIDSRTCNLCEACFKLCPNQALSLTEEGLEINQSLCNGCSLCTDVCTIGSISVSLKARQAGKSSLDVARIDCSGCGSPFYVWPDEITEECSFCRERRQRGYLNPNGN
ncbi:hypothetical protein A8F94_23795 [Bacillus sp. FJAT-27225]|uniref:4Fe-4S binding protein n=1 Tax=Bacillus sp. FJAT-27225 TaxID=1743144 RepID=UPI00080C28B7|nr:4Fe-4S dicluster domain-containing protein [Bacillus sp. FJAT-27225]OCA89271.1 hypothetical protein A8F94_23795 [Bacillus sp. FJAT-27225]